jgi:hypothetical protein
MNAGRPCRGRRAWGHAHESMYTGPAGEGLGGAMRMLAGCSVLLQGSLLYVRLFLHSLRYILQAATCATYTLKRPPQSGLLMLAILYTI